MKNLTTQNCDALGTLRIDERHARYPFLRFALHGLLCAFWAFLHQAFPSPLTNHVAAISFGMVSVELMTAVETTLREHHSPGLSLSFFGIALLINLGHSDEPNGVILLKCRMASNTDVIHLA